MRDTGTLPDVRVTDEHEVNQDVDNKGNVIRLDYCVQKWMKGIIYSVKVGTRDALLGRILDARECISMSQWKPQKSTSAVHNRVAKCKAAACRIF